VAGHVNSPVALSEEAPFERKFSSIFDTLLQAEFDFDQLLRALRESHLLILAIDKANVCQYTVINGERLPFRVINNPYLIRNTI